MRDEDIDTSDIPELGPEFFKTAMFWPGTKQQITLRLDPDVLAFFRGLGKRYQTTINAVLRRYMERATGNGNRPSARRARARSKANPRRGR